MRVLEDSRNTEEIIRLSKWLVKRLWPYNVASITQLEQNGWVVLESLSHLHIEKAAVRYSRTEQISVKFGTTGENVSEDRDAPVISLLTAPEKVKVEEYSVLRVTLWTIPSQLERSVLITDYEIFIVSGEKGEKSTRVRDWGASGSLSQLSPQELRLFLKALKEALSANQ